MSIETLLREQTAAIAENTSAMRQLIASLNIQAYAEASQPAVTPVKESAKPAKKAAQTVPVVQEIPQDDTPEAAATPLPAEDADLADAPKVTREQTADAITTLARIKGRQVAVDILAKFNAKRLPDVTDEHIPAVYAAAQAAMGGAE